MATPPSSYGERPPLQSYRRSFTVPSRQLSIHERAGLDKSDADADILYFHPNARIIAFSPPTDSIQSQSKETLPDADYPIDAVEILPWRSRTETLASSGPIKIEKVRGSSHFLKSADQKVIQTIMRNSQCWCVDGESKFVLRTGKLKYYRIELPSEAEEDKQKVDEFKTALGKVLRFERTPCPFKRAFHVDLPDDAITPRRKGTWKRRQPLQPTTPNTDPLPLRKTKNSRAWSLQGQSESSPLQPYGRRGSDYGFGASRGSSRSRLEADDHRSSTPSSVVSSEDAYGRRQEDGYSDDGLQGEDETDQHQVEHSSTSEPELEEPANPSEHQYMDNASVQDQNARPEEVEDISENPPRDPPSVEISERLAIDVTAPLVRPQDDDPSITVSEETNTPQEARQDSEDEVPKDEISLEAVPSRQSPETNLPMVCAVEPSMEPDEESATSVAAEQNPVLHPSYAPESSVTNEESQLTNDLPPESAQPHTQEEDTGTNEDVASEHNHDTLSRVSSVDSFYTTDSLTQDMLDEKIQAIDFEKAPDTEGFTPFFLHHNQHHRGLSELTVTASTIASEQSPQKQRPSTSDSTPGLATSSMSDSSWPEVHTPPTSPIKETLRRRLQTKRSLSPLPPSTTLYSPTTSPANHGSPFTAQFLQKAANVALVKPIEAVVLLVHILARIAGGATLNDLFSGDLFRRPNEREQGPHRRRTSFPDQVAQPRDDSDDGEDDFGVPIRGRTKSVEASSPSKAKENKVERDDDQDSIFDLD